jgi:Spy/CpxP family protein refolding chaperone
MIARHLGRITILLFAACFVAATAVSAQRGGGNIQVGGGSGKTLTRMDMMVKAFTLDDDQARQFRAAFDEGQKNAAPIKAALAQAHAAIGAAIQSAKGQAEVDKAVLDYATQSAAMASVEVKSLAAAMKSLRPEQLANQAAVTSALAMVHGMYLDKWDSAPPWKTY